MRIQILKTTHDFSRFRFKSHYSNHFKFLFTADKGQTSYQSNGNIKCFKIEPILLFYRNLDFLNSGHVFSSQTTSAVA